MTRIGLLSDTHGYWDERYLKYFEPCDQIWHAGDIGSMEIVERLEAFRPLKAVYGNIDGQDMRRLFPETARFTVDGADVLMKHIGGYPGKYDASIRSTLFANPPQLFISGHSHILKVKYDKSLNLLHINPGAAGIYGFHTVRTLVRFSIDKGRFSDLEVIELNK
ncbi:metallophosphoesterase family protein [Phocaeicola sp. HCN-6420]|jgi:putative phosphoesterase|uniref:metallophosphoesterase family protein n=1 Tax=Phocaeicola sp. HCN-6420 TaxID=3134673 RepID=UPI0030BEA20E